MNGLIGWRATRRKQEYRNCDGELIKFEVADEFNCELDWEEKTRHGKAAAKGTWLWGARGSLALLPDGMWPECMTYLCGEYIFQWCSNQILPAWQTAWASHSSSHPHRSSLQFLNHLNHRDLLITFWDNKCQERSWILRKGPSSMGNARTLPAWPILSQLQPASLLWRDWPLAPVNTSTKHSTALSKRLMISYGISIR